MLISLKEKKCVFIFCLIQNLTDILSSNVSYLQRFVGGLMSYLLYVCLFVYIVQSICGKHQHDWNRNIFLDLLVVNRLQNNILKVYQNLPVLWFCFVCLRLACPICCRFLWVVQLGLSLRYSLTFIMNINF